jgi:hypothetical protein
VCLYSVFGALRFLGGLGSLGPRTSALFGPSAETGKLWIEESKHGNPQKRGARGICRFCRMVNPAQCGTQGHAQKKYTTYKREDALFLNRYHGL